MTAPEPHRSPKAPHDLEWDWARNAARYTGDLLEHGGWGAMARAHAWREGGADLPERKSAYKLPHHRLLGGRIRVVLAGVDAAMNIIAATRFQPDKYQLHVPASELEAVYRHLAAHLGQFGEKVPAILKGWSPAQGWPPR